ncbi:NeuD/PglB/VioB family sugar acetyltransferase [Halodesulfovibrio sp.]|uniref:NeuD/PglB/VioB family sugar acetyltransferase n=1 Tax=Halodesulfovibrio sp. TaxID=1912772 RepID=UPI0025DD4B16|nr:NeuD/PglB/VioB family sugar acetyltransferase [Halodesulfovibrio sp.]MCT4626528.1 NeuD/PglB/VioB family sugar acetyltransferase [Halodesulfovibrio sp.]
MPTSVAIIGAGGHSKVAIEALRAMAPSCSLRVFDQDRAKKGRTILGGVAIEFLQEWSALPEAYHIAIGNNSVRQQLSMLAQANGKEYTSIIHPEASISPSAVVGEGVFAAAKAVVAAESKIDEGCIINHSAVVDHECRIGAYSHIAPGSILTGGVEVGECTLIGAGAVILPMIKIGRNVVVGAGAVVTRDIPDHQIVVGIPERIVNSNE